MILLFGTAGGIYIAHDWSPVCDRLCIVGLIMVLVLCIVAAPHQKEEEDEEDEE